MTHPFFLGIIINPINKWWVKVIGMGCHVVNKQEQEQQQRDGLINRVLIGVG